MTIYLCLESMRSKHKCVQEIWFNLCFYYSDCLY